MMASRSQINSSANENEIQRPITRRSCNEIVCLQCPIDMFTQENRIYSLIPITVEPLVRPTVQLHLRDPRRIIFSAPNILNDPGNKMKRTPFQDLEESLSRKSARLSLPLMNDTKTIGKVYSHNQQNFISEIQETQIVAQKPLEMFSHMKKCKIHRDQVGLHEQVFLKRDNKQTKINKCQIASKNVTIEELPWEEVDKLCSECRSKNETTHCDKCFTIQWDKTAKFLSQQCRVFKYAKQVVEEQ
ncbi:uncharacterized protein LOC131675449 [Phymastichus coffea]|uniref:uncharacterized protein LOC131675449 n=1 Tax=Phymastichus coffea TaxID=108790 RepID=UPI00273C353F|nr:uncharacterized protein LOC131675449 [Phymastichus coffea]